METAENLVADSQQGWQAQTDAITRLSEVVASRPDLGPELQAIVEVLARNLDRQAAIESQLVATQQQLAATQQEVARWRSLAADFESAEGARWHLQQAARFKALMVFMGQMKGPP